MHSKGITSTMLILMGILVALLGAECAPTPAPADNVQAQQEEAAAQEQALIMKGLGGISQFTVTGSNSDFGRYVALGEVTLVPGQEAGVLQEGTGVAMLKAENGDAIVAEVTCQVTDTGMDFTFHWRDSVTFSTGSTVSNTGAFVEQRPPGLSLRKIGGYSFSSDGAGYVCKQCCENTCVPSLGCGRFCGKICWYADQPPRECPTQ